MTDKPITERLLERPYRVRNHNSDRYTVFDITTRTTVASFAEFDDAEAAADRLNGAHQLKVFAEAQEAAFREGYRLNDEGYVNTNAAWLASDTRKALVEGGAE